jgi:hypothetical protein
MKRNLIDVIYKLKYLIFRVRQLSGSSSSTNYNPFKGIKPKLINCKKAKLKKIQKLIC